MTIFGGDTASCSYELRIAAGAAANLAKKILPTTISAIVASEIGWMKDSTWVANHARLKLVIAEINALAERQQERAA